MAKSFNIILEVEFGLLSQGNEDASFSYSIIFKSSLLFEYKYFVIVPVAVYESSGS